MIVKGMSDSMNGQRIERWLLTIIANVDRSSSGIAGIVMGIPAIFITLMAATLCSPIET